MKFHSLASSSAGNAYLVESAGSVLMIDCGIAARSEMLARMGSVGISPDSIVGIVFTHDHSDHAKGLGVFHRKFPDIPLFANLMTSEAIASSAGVPEEEFIPFENGQSFEVGPFEVCAFPIPHDVPDPVGFMVRAEGIGYFHATDVGTPLDSIGVHLAEADYATLEANHDRGLLAGSDRSEMLKRRIRGPRGHLSNDEAADLVRRFASRRLKALRLAHLSCECNAPHLADAAVRDALRDIAREDVDLAVLPPYEPVTWGAA